MGRSPAVVLHSGVRPRPEQLPDGALPALRGHVVERGVAQVVPRIQLGAVFKQESDVLLVLSLRRSSW